MRLEIGKPTVATPARRSRHLGRLRRPPTPWLADVERGRVAATSGIGSISRLPAHADVAVVGGGVIGVAAAYALARLGVDVLVLESRLPGWGASGRNAGLVLGAPATLETVRTTLRDERIDAGFEQRGHLALAASETVLESFRRELAARPPGAAPLQLLDHKECEALLGTPIAPRFLGGRWMPSGSALHPARFVYGLAAAVVRHGGAVASRAAVLGLRRSATAAGGGGWVVQTERGQLRARQVVLACNSGSARLFPPLARLLAPTRGQMLATDPLPAIFGPAMAVDYGALYWRQTADGSVVLGGCQHLDPEAERTARTGLNPRIQAALERFLPEAFPAIGRVSVRWRWAGIMDATPDGRPVVGAWPGESGLWVAAGFGGHGLPPALGVGQALARAIVAGGGGGARSPEIDALDPARFPRATLELA